MGLGSGGSRPDGRAPAGMAPIAVGARLGAAAVASIEAARGGRSAFSLGPLLTGAAAGAYLNSRETRRLGQEVRRDLRRRALPD